MTNFWHVSLMKNGGRLIILAMLFLSSCKQSSTGISDGKAFADGDMDRTLLPIREPVRQSYSELDVRNAKAPGRFEVKAPKDAPNVLVVLIDDIGFGASEAFGGPIHMPTLNKLASHG